MSPAVRSPLGIVFYGKGGVGKSTLTAHIAVALQRAGRRVLLVGCDPKQDASARFRTDRPVESLVARIAARRGITFDDLVVRTSTGVDLLETGGPEPGTGCAGRGVTRVCEMLEADRVQERGYDVLVFDVLGDLVCGGFVAPIRFGFADRVFIVSSEEVASLFVVNNVAGMVRRSRQGVSAGGVLFNLKRPDAPVDVLNQFCRRVGLPVVGHVQRDPAILDAEACHMTVFETAAGGPVARGFEDLARRVSDIALAPALPAPAELDLDAFWTFVREHRDLL